MHLEGTVLTTLSEGAREEMEGKPDTVEVEARMGERGAEPQSSQSRATSVYQDRLEQLRAATKWEGG